MLSVAILAASTLSSAAQRNECFEIHRNTTSGPAGAILLNKCTGETWLLVSTTVRGADSASRWYPIKVENVEAVIPSLSR
jgi:hypothetical protein